MSHSANKLHFYLIYAIRLHDFVSLWHSKYTLDMAKVTIHDIADALGISASTVSRALTDHPKISQKTKSAVGKKARELGYHGAVAAPASGPNKLVALLVPNQESAFLRQTIGCLHRHFARRGLQLLLLQSYEQYTNERQAVEELVRLRPMAVIAALASNSPNAQHFAAVQAAGIPLVFFYRVDYGFAAPRVVIDNYHAAYKATRHLIDNGYRRIAHLAGVQTCSVYAEMSRGYRAALDDAGIAFRPEFLIESDLSDADARECMNRLYGPGTQPNAIFAASNHAALQALIYLKNNGIRVPNQVGVLSYGYNPAGAFFIPSISTIEQPAEDIAQTIYRITCDLIDEHPLEKETTVHATKLIIRSSSLPS